MRKPSALAPSHLLVFALVFGLIGIIIWKSIAAPNPNLPGDLNGDNTVDATDLSILLSDFGTNKAEADINGDGTVDVLDLSTLLSHYGQSISSFTTNISQNMTITTPFTWTFNPGVTTTAGYFYADGNQLAEVTGPGPYSFTITTSTLTAGAHTLGGSWDLPDGTHVTFPQDYPVTINNGSGGGGGANLGTSLPSRMPFSSGGNTYYVDGTNGSDSNNGTAAAPWQTINYALATVPLSGSIIRVMPGTYTSTGTSSYAINFSRSGDTSNPITLMANTPGTVTIANSDPNSATIGGWIHEATGLRLEGLTFKVTNNQSVDNGYTGLLIEDSDWIEVYDCTFNEMASMGISVRGGPPGSSADNDWIIDNTFRPSGSDPTAQVTGLGYPNNTYFGSKGSHWIYAGQWGQDPSDGNWDQTDGSTNLVIANNLFTGSAAGRDIELGPEARYSYVVNNTFYGNQSLSVVGVGDPSNDASAEYAGEGVVLFNNTSTTAYSNGYNIITNNIFDYLFGHAVYGSGSTEPGNVVQKNLAYQTSNGGGYNGDTSLDYLYYYGDTSVILFSTGSGNYPDANPLFGNPSSYNFQLQSGSPAIGQADPAYSYPTDITGKARPAAPDLGAYQH